MRKYLLLFASAALLFTGCSKEKFGQDAVSDGETVEVSIETSLPMSGPATRAVWDNDGNAAYVDHWIMEVYDKDEALYDRKELKGQTGLTKTFTVTLIKNQNYKFVFWADREGSYETAKLTDIKAVLSSDSRQAGKDSLDAFFCMKPYKSTRSESVSAVLNRPFGQVNVVTLDTKKVFDEIGNAAEYGKFIPKNLKVTAKVYNGFNALADTLADLKPVTLTESECYGKTPYSYADHRDSTTLFMDYLFVGKEQELVDLAFEFESHGEKVEYAFASVPMQRNYRTNIFGNLLSDDAEWTVTVDPIWKTPDTDIIPVVSVSLDKSDMTLFVGDDTTLVATALPENATQDRGVTWASSDEKVATVDEDGKVKAVAIGTATITATSKANVLEKATCTVTVDHEFVEMAGLKWAACNIGAENPTKAGWYFSWGNIDGYVHDGSQWVSASDGTPLDGFKKSIYESTVGFTLSSSIAPGSGHDAARENWGMDWRMPSSAEFQALYEACGGEGSKTVPATLETADPVKGVYWLASDQALISAYTGVAGLLFVDESKTQLFFPVTGYGTNLNLNGLDSGRYWSSTYDVYDEKGDPLLRTAYKLYFTSNTVQPQFNVNGYCERGYAIRPVKEIDE